MFLWKELAGGLGFEPRLAESESAVLPLDDPPTKAPGFSMALSPRQAGAERSKKASRFTEFSRPIRLPCRSAGAT